jgi:hypothetical protein
MRLLLDESIPSRLRQSLTEYSVRTVVEAGWSGVKNGKLLALAAAEFDAFVMPPIISARLIRICHDEIRFDTARIRRLPTYTACTTCESRVAALVPDLNARKLTVAIDCCGSRTHLHLNLSVKHRSATAAP